MADLDSIVEAFYDETGKYPTVAEFFSLLLWAMKTTPIGDRIDDNIAGLEGIAVRLEARVVQVKYQQVFKHVGELNDDCFSRSADYVANIAKSGVSLQAMLDHVVAELKEGKKNVFDGATNGEVQQAHAILSEKKRPRIKRGDVISIPLDMQSFAIGIMTDKTPFGIALWIYSKRFEHLAPADLKQIGILPVPEFTENSALDKGRWKILFNDESLLSVLPGKIERFHRPEQENTKPFGVAETPEGELRKLTKEEAERLGVLEKGFEQAFTATGLEKYLNKHL